MALHRCIKWITKLGMACASGALLCTGANAAIGTFNVTTVPPAATYTTGANNFEFQIEYGSPDLEFLEQVIFTFPAGVTVTGVAGNSPWAGCLNLGLNTSFTPNTATWTAPGHPTVCGAFPDGTYGGFLISVNVAPGFVGPMTVTVHGDGDGWGAAPHGADTNVVLNAIGAGVVQPVPTLSEYSLGLLALLFAAGGASALRRRQG